MLSLNSKYFTIPFILILISFSLKAQLTPQEAIIQMQKGINLGNTHEPPTEGGWNNPKAEEYYFDMYKAEGFDLVRIPVRWDNYTGKTTPYKVETAWLNRIEEVVDWGLERGLFIIINSHHDDWIKDNYTDANKARFDSIWTQISERFKDKSDSLIFEVLNEPHGLSKANNDEMHQRIISIIRKTNPTRLIIFQGNNWGSSGDLINAQIPDDDYVIGSFHSYDPYRFGLLGEGTWGTAGDIGELDNKFKGVSNWSKEHNIPVFLGEFGALKKCDYNSRMRHYRTYISLAQKYGFACAAWDDGGNFRIMERQQHDWDEVKDILLHTTKKSPWPLATVFQDSIVKIQWNNYVHNHDSIIIERRLSTQQHYSTIATINPDSIKYYDIKPDMNSTFSYRVIAHYNDTSDLYSHPYKIFFPAWERKVRAAFNDTLMTIPGIIEAEHFDYGGEGLAYHDLTETNIPGDFRPNDNVDIYGRGNDGYHIGNALAGEWCEYWIDVKAEGWYDVTAYIAAMYGGGTFQIKVDTVQSEIMTALQGWSWLNTKPVSTKMYLFPGKQIMRFSVLSDPLFNIDKISFEIATATNDYTFQKDIPFKSYQNSFGELIIKQNQNKQVERLNIYSVSGSLIYSVVKPDIITTIPSGKTPRGIYIIQSVVNNKKYSQKVVVN